METGVAGAFGIASIGPITDRDFRRISRLVHETYGINLTEAKRALVESRLRRRVVLNGHDSYGAYADFVFSDEGRERELAHMVDAITTNKTDFFREPGHFQELTNTVLPEIVDEASHVRRTSEPVRVWSAACSTGEEPYTLGMVLSEYRRTGPRFEFEILGTDLSTRALDIARTAVYDEGRIVPVPQEYRKRYLRRGTGDYEGFVRIAPVVRQHVSFASINLLQADAYDLGCFDLVFLRNVIIYFDRETKQRVVRKVIRKLRPGGYLFVGHSETLFDMDVPVELVRPTVYRRVKE
ncbi:MAG: CheR family methyltransferase [Spirochaetota bacterium]